MAKKSIGKELLGAVEPLALKHAAIGAFLSFVVFIGTVVTFEPLVASYMGAESTVLAQARGGSGEDADMEQARRAADAIERERAYNRSVQDFSRRQTERDNRYYRDNQPREGDTRYVDGSIYKYVQGRWVCVYNCKPTGPETKTF
jgi:hypothetical protein